MQFGKKFDRNEAQDGGNQSYIRNFKDGVTVVRFLEELDSWTGYWECYDVNLRGGKGASYPSPGKDSQYNTERVSRRYLVNCLVDGKVVLYKVPASLMDRITRRSDKYETLVDRDYEITRSGKGLSTEYDIETGDRGKIDISAYTDQFTSHEQALSDAFMDAFGHLPDTEDNQDPPARKAAPKERAQDSQNDRSGYNDDPPSEPQQSEGGAAEETVLSEDQIREMSRGELLDLAEEAGLDVDKDLSRAEIADFIIEKLAD